MQDKSSNPRRSNLSSRVYISLVIGTLLVGVAASIAFPLICKEDGSWINPETNTIGGRPLFACAEMYATWACTIIATISLATVITIAFLIKKSRSKKPEIHADKKS